MSSAATTSPSSPCSWSRASGPGSATLNMLDSPKAISRVIATANRVPLMTSTAWILALTRAGLALTRAGPRHGGDWHHRRRGLDGDHALRGSLGNGKRVDRGTVPDPLRGRPAKRVWVLRQESEAEGWLATAVGSPSMSTGESCASRSRGGALSAFCPCTHCGSAGISATRRHREVRYFA